MTLREVPRPRSERYPFAHFPSGWYAVAYGHELTPGVVVSRRYFGRELVAFRDGDGRAAVLDAFCPHLGAHLGHGSRVDGGALRCPMHGFRFDREGRCLSTPYAAKAPPTARAGAWPVLERHGVVLVWHDAAGGPPAWEVPEVDAAGMGAPQWRSFDLAAHPQETTENAVDFGHLAEVHGYREIDVRNELKLDGPTLAVGYAMTRDSPFGAGGPVRAEFEIRAWGLGVSFVEVRVAGTTLHTHHHVFVTPKDGDRCDLRALIRVDETLRPARVHPALALLPRPIAARLVRRLAFAAFLNDIAQDFRVWEHKRYVDPPALAAGDGPLGRYRQWARQFYPAA